MSQENNVDKMRAEYESIKVPDELSKNISDIIEKNTKEKRPPYYAWIRRVCGSVAAAVLIIVFAANINASASNFLSNIPVIGAFAKIVTFRDFTDHQKNTEADIKAPHITNLGDKTVEDKLNAEFDKYADELINQYESDVAAMDKMSGAHEAIESKYEVLINTDKQLTIAMYTVIARGGAQQINTYYNIDKSTGKLLSINDLFKPGADYITAISNNIINQMKDQMKKDSSKTYFIGTDPGSFSKISKNQQFYINSKGKLVISFNEYDVAPGVMGAVSFEIPTSVISGILSDNNLIK